MGLYKNIIISGLATHNMLAGRSTADAHPESAITGLTADLSELAADIATTTGYMLQAHEIEILSTAWTDKAAAIAGDYITGAGNQIILFGPKSPMDEAAATAFAAAKIRISA